MATAIDKDTDIYRFELLPKVLCKLNYILRFNKGIISLVYTSNVLQHINVHKVPFGLCDWRNKSIFNFETNNTYNIDRIFLYGCVKINSPQNL